MRPGRGSCDLVQDQSRINVDSLTIIVLYAMNTTILCAGYFRSFVRRRVYSILWGALAGYQILSFVQLNFYLSSFSSTALVKGQFLMLLSNLLLFAGCFALEMVFLRIQVSRTDLASDLPRNRYYLVVAFSLGLAFVLLLRNGTLVFYSNWEQSRESGNVLDVMSNLLGFIFFPCLWLLFKERKLFVGSMLSILNLLFFQISGARSIVMSLFCVAYFDLLLSKVAVVKKVLIMGLLCVVAFGFHSFFRLVRGMGAAVFLSTTFSGGLPEYLSTYEDVDYSGGESEIYNYFYYIIEKDYGPPSYRCHTTLLRLALLYVPTSLASEFKPGDITYQIWYDALRDGYLRVTYLAELKARAARGQFGSLHPTLWGDAYASSGLLGICVYPLVFCCGVITLEHVISRVSSFCWFTLVPAIGVCYLLVARGNVVIGVGFIGCFAPLLFLISLVARLSLFTQLSKEPTSHASNSTSR